MKILITILIFSSILFLGHSCTVENPCSLSEETWEGLKKIDSLLKDSTRREIHKGWMKNTYDEPDLLEAGCETYRFVKKSFGWYNYTKIVRIEKLEDHYKTIVKEFVDTIEYGVFTKIKNIEIELSKEDWYLITEKLETDNFWISTATNYIKLLHGGSWYIEGYKLIKNKCSMRNYHVIHGIYPVDSLYIALHNLFDNLENEKRATHKNENHQNNF